MPSFVHDRTVPDRDPTDARPPVVLIATLLFANAAAIVAAFVMPAVCGTDAMLRLVRALA